MSRSPRSYGPRDVAFPQNLRDGSDIIKNRKYQQLLQYLFDQSRCPVDSRIAKKIMPTKPIPNEIERAYNNFQEFYRNDSIFFKQVPVFTTLYLSRFITVKNLQDSTLNFIEKFLSAVPVSTLDIQVLDILIPITLYKMYIPQSSPIFSFVVFLAKYFGYSEFLPYFLRFISVIINDNVIGHYHVDLMNDLYDRFDFSREDSKKIADKILEPLEGTNSIHLGLALKELHKRILRKYTGIVPSFSDSPLSKSTASLSSSALFDRLQILLNQLENRQYGNPAAIIAEIKQQLEFAERFPDRSPLPLFELALRLYASDESQKDLVYSLIMILNNICSVSDLRQIYQQLKNDNNIPFEFLNFCYQQFRKLNLLEDDPSSLLSSQKFASPRSTNAHLKEAFRMLLDWETAYDGVTKIWEYLIKVPDIHDIMEFYDSLDYAQKSYLVQGLRVKYDDVLPNNDDLKHTIETLENDFYSKKVFLDTSGDFIHSTASSTSSTQNMETLRSQSSIERLNAAIKSPKSPKIQESPTTRKRYVSNGASLKTRSHIIHI